MMAERQYNLAENVAFRLEREFDAPVAEVWRAWTERDRLLQWWGPKGFPCCHADLDLRVGGRFHYGLELPDGGVMWGRWDIERIEPERRLEFLALFSDENGGGPTRHPWDPDWPLLVYSVIRFQAHGDSSRLGIEWIPADATLAEIERFGNGHDDCRQGWGGTLEQLQTYLEEHKS